MEIQMIALYCISITNMHGYKFLLQWKNYKVKMGFEPEKAVLSAIAGLFSSWYFIQSVVLVLMNNYTHDNGNDMV